MVEIVFVMMNLTLSNTEPQRQIPPSLTFISLKVVSFPDTKPGATFLMFSLPYAANVRITLFDCHGRELQSIFHQWKNSGTHIIESTIDQLPGGKYFYQLKTSYDSAIRILTVE